MAVGAVAAGALAQDAPDDACPRAALRQMMSVGARHDAIADVAALELEVLRLCVERQELIGEIVEGNRELAGLRGSTTGAAPAPDVRRPRLSWLTVYGSAGEWVAGVSDGAKVWYVRAGDVLPSGVKVVSVRVRPAGVEVGRNGEQWQIPGPAGRSR